MTVHTKCWPPILKTYLFIPISVMKKMRKEYSRKIGLT